MSSQALFSGQGSIAFPASLSEKYKPRTLDSFVGLEKPKKVLTNFLARPFPTAFLFVGPSGTGKTSLAEVLAATMNAETHSIPSQQCTVAEIDRVAAQCQRAPWIFYGENAGKPASWHVVRADEADKMSNAAQLRLLSILDGSAPCPNTVFIFTCNSVEGFEPRFLSRCMALNFSSQGLAQPTAKLLESVWIAEAGETAERPNFLRMVQDSKNNVRDAINSLQVELLAL